MATDYQLATYAAAHFPDIPDRKQREHAAETDLTHLFFARRSNGFFVEVGAYHPTVSSQTWGLEQAGWTGLLVEPTPSLCDLLREKRPRSTVVQAACGAPDSPPVAKFYLSAAGSQSTLAPDRLNFKTEVQDAIEVQVKTLDQILEDAGSPELDFLSIDVEGLQLDVMRGFSLDKHRPKLLLIEDHLLGIETHRYITRRGYRLVKRTALNNWYVPEGTCFTMTGPLEKLKLYRKVWIGTPWRALRASRRRR